MAGTKVTEKLEEVSSEQVSLSAQLGELVEFRKGELKRIQQEVLNEQATKAGIKRECEQLKLEAKNDAARIKAEAQESVDAAWRELQGSQRAVELQKMEVEGRLRQVEELEATAEPLRQERNALNEERLAVEQQRLRNDELRMENDRLSNEHSAFQVELARREQEVVRLEITLRAQAAELDQWEAKLKEQETSVKVALENLESLKSTVDPKLKEITRLSEQASADTAQAALLRQETEKAQAKLEEQKTALATLSNQLQAKGEALVEYDASLKRTSAELQIKIQQSGLKVKAPVAPKE